MLDLSKLYSIVMSGENLHSQSFSHSVNFLWGHVSHCFEGYSGRDKGRMRIRMRMVDTDEKIRMGKCGWGIKRGWENADGG